MTDPWTRISYVGTLVFTRPRVSITMTTNMYWSSAKCIAPGPTARNALQREHPTGHLLAAYEQVMRRIFFFSSALVAVKARASAAALLAIALVSATAALDATSPEGFLAPRLYKASFSLKVEGEALQGDLQLARDVGLARLDNTVRKDEVRNDHAPEEDRDLLHELVRVVQGHLRIGQAFPLVIGRPS